MYYVIPLLFALMDVCVSGTTKEQKSNHPWRFRDKWGIAVIDIALTIRSRLTIKGLFDGLVCVVSCVAHEALFGYVPVCLLRLLHMTSYGKFHVTKISIRKCKIHRCT